MASLLLSAPRQLSTAALRVCCSSLTAAANPATSHPRFGDTPGFVPNCLSRHLGFLQSLRQSKLGSSIEGTSRSPFQTPVFIGRGRRPFVGAGSLACSAMASDGTAGHAGHLKSHGNIALLEHININTDLPLECCTFFVDGLGFSLDPRQGAVVDGRVYLDSLIWFNAGMTQVHMPVTTRGAPGTLRNIFNGHICIAYEDLGGLCKRLETVEGALKHTKFSWSRLDDGRVEAVDPLGNRWLAESRPRDERDERGFQPGPRSPCHGITAIEFNAPKGTTHHIAEYYRRYFNAEASAEGGVARVATGPRQELRFREDPTCWLGQPGVAYENQTYGLHIAVYLYDHLSAMQRLATDNMLWGNPRYEKLDEGLGLSQFRCKDIMAQVSQTREPALLYELEHEVRTLDHATSPFKHSQPYLLAGLEAVPELVSSVTSDHERDFAAERRKRMSAKKGFVPRPLGVCYEPIQFYTWDTPNGKKISILLEELKLPYQVIPVDISAGEQRFPEFLEVCPNGKIPAIRDPNQGGAGPLTVFESGAILMYLAERYGRRELLPRSPEGRIRCQEWLFFQVSGFGPAAGQVHHFAGLMEGQEDAEVKSAAAYGFARYHSEVTRQYGVMDAWLSKNEYFTGDEYTIADIAIFSWVWRAWRHKIDLHEFPNVKRWYDKISQRRAVLSGLQVPGKLLPTLGMINQICG